MANRTKLTSQKKEQFLELLATTGNVTLAAREVGLSRTTVYDHRGEDAEFSAKWDNAVEEGVDALEAEARRRAYIGVDEPVFYQGRRVGAVRRYSDTLLIFLLKAHRPDKYREVHQVQIPQQPPTIDYSQLSQKEIDELERILSKAKPDARASGAMSPQPRTVH